MMFLTDEVKSERVCSPFDVIEYLNMTDRNPRFTSTRPIKNWKNTTYTTLHTSVNTIIELNEKAQTLTAMVWTTMKWKNEFVKWDPQQFCGITKITVAVSAMWIPELYVYEL
nr:PREDICTED: 5-hydroxytryptamine receptor 3A-like [Latimeria chalumnae]|eukprot:XP_014352243.1 PREDICTED: 5-hydroxytryptamine receptor 3A-like [Latimeria chalumnae]